MLQVYCHAKNPKEIYYQFEDEPEAAPESATTSEPAAAAAVCYLDLDTRAGHRAADVDNVGALQSKLDAIAREQGAWRHLY